MSSTLAVAMFARIPLSSIGLLVVLQIRHLGHSYALGGACSGACALGMAVLSPVLGRAVDRMGQIVVVACAGAAVTASSVLFALIPADAPGAVFVVVSGAIGAAQPPIASCVRVLWRRTLKREDFNALVTFDASLQELAFMLGPLVLVSAASAVGAAAALAISGAVLGLASMMFTTLPEVRRLARARDQPEPETPRQAVRALSAPGVPLLLAVAAAMGLAFGATELSVVTLTDHLGSASTSGLMFALWSAGSVLGGLAWARRRIAGRAVVHSMCWMMVICAVTTSPLGGAPSIGVLGAGLVVAGVAVAPLFGALYSLMGDVVPLEVLTEAYTLETSAITAGLAVGFVTAGSLANAFGAPATFVLAGAAHLAGALLLRTRRRELSGIAQEARGRGDHGDAPRRTASGAVLDS